MKAESSLSRLALLYGDSFVEAMAGRRVLVFGLGGVGSWAAEALLRSGVGRLGLVDYDTVMESNLNRQLEATEQTIGLPKAEALDGRLNEIRRDCTIEVYNERFEAGRESDFDLENSDYVIDAIDSLSCKLDLIEAADRAGTKLFSSMGMARKTDPSRLQAADIWDTQVCPLARRVREGLRSRAFGGHFTVVYSREEPAGERADGVNGSVVTVTAAAGFLLASLVLNDVKQVLAAL